MLFVFYFSLGIANQEQRSLAQRCELWKKSSQEKDLVCERAEKDKAVLSEKIQVRRIITTWFFKWKSIAFIYDLKYIPRKTGSYSDWFAQLSRKAWLLRPLKIFKSWPHIDIPFEIYVNEVLAIFDATAFLWIVRDEG